MARGTGNPYADRHERDIADLLPGGQITIASGNKYEKNDVVTERDGSWWRFSIENKCTHNKGFRLTHELWDDVRMKTLTRSPELRAGIALRFYGDGHADYAEVLADLVAIDVNDLAEMLHEMNRMRSRIEELES